MCDFRTMSGRGLTAAIFREKPLLWSATISAYRRRIAAFLMSYSPSKLRVCLILLALATTSALPAHARRNRFNTTNPNPENQTQTSSQPVPVPSPYSMGVPSGGYVPSSAPPDARIQIQPPPRPQYAPLPSAPGSYVVPAPGAAGNPNPYRVSAITPPPSTTTPAAQTTQSYVAADYPPKPPRVSFRNGQLSISAENSTLPDILSAIHQRTGAAMELPSTISNERVAVKLGPATTGEVMAALLNGSHFDYIVLNRPEDPSSPERIILREKIAADANAPNNNNGYNNGYVASAQPPSYQPPEVQEVPETVPDEEVPEVQPQPRTSTSPGGEEANPNPKTPEQLLEELRQMQQQQRGQPPQQMQPQQPPLGDNGEPQ